jgi:FtsH-binding integral membrane protein
MATNQNGNGPVETKVSVASITAFVVTTVMGFVLTYWPTMPDTISNPLASVIAGAVTGVLTFVLAWLAKHTNRTDAQAARGKHVN